MADTVSKLFAKNESDYSKVMKQEQKKALVLGGGGSKGSYSIGVLRSLQNRDFSIVTGTSIGALIGAAYVSRGLEPIAKWAASFSPAMVSNNLFAFPEQHQNFENLSLNEFLSKFGAEGPSVAPLRKSFSTLFNWDSFERSPVDYGCQTWNVSEGKPAAFTKKDMSQENYMDILMASAAYFPAFNFVEMNGDQYADGGFDHPVPWDLALNMGAEKMIVISLQDPESSTSLPENDEHTELLVRPLLKLEYFLDFEAEDMIRQEQQGYLEGLKYQGLAPGYLYTFYPEDWDSILKLEKSALDLQKELQFEIPEDAALSMLSWLLGYKPWPLENDYMGQYKACRIVEALALAAGISPYNQYHFDEWLDQILQVLSSARIDLSLPASKVLYSRMEKAGVLDLLVFIHAALVNFQGALPSRMAVFRKNFSLPWYLGIAWYLIELYQKLQPNPLHIKAAVERYKNLKKENAKKQ